LFNKSFQNFLEVALIGGYRNIIWGTGGPPGGGESGALVIGIEPPNVPEGTGATGHLVRAQAKSTPAVCTVTYGPLCSGPASVTIPAFTTQVTFPVSTHTGTGNADLSATGANGASSLPGPVQGNNIIWGT